MGQHCQQMCGTRTGKSFAANWAGIWCRGGGHSENLISCVCRSTASGRRAGCGPDSQVATRISKVSQLITLAAQSRPSKLNVSLITYGPHALVRDEKEEPPVVLAWNKSPDQAQAALRSLGISNTRWPGYRRAAQLECALAEAAIRLHSEHGRVVLVTVGNRQPFPPRIDFSEIPPCPLRRDWQTVTQRLSGYPEISFGAISDQGRAEHEIWRVLSQDASANPGDLNNHDFAHALGLLGHEQSIPFPLHAAD